MISSIKLIYFIKFLFKFEISPSPMSSETSVTSNVSSLNSENSIINNDFKKDSFIRIKSRVAFDKQSKKVKDYIKAITLENWYFFENLVSIWFFIKKIFILFFIYPSAHKVFSIKGIITMVVMLIILGIFLGLIPLFITSNKGKYGF